MSYYLKVYDNFHYMDEDETYFVKGIGTAEEALRTARGMVESFFLENWKPGVDYSTVNAMYTMYGLDPVICSDSGEDVKFSAWKYAGEIAHASAAMNWQVQLKNCQLMRRRRRRRRLAASRARVMVLAVACNENLAAAAKLRKAMQKTAS